VAAEAEAMQLRSDRYLMARGYRTSPAMIQDLIRMAPIRTAGEQDFRACGSAKFSCMLECLGPLGGKRACDGAECFFGGKIPLICIKPNRCTRPDSLP
jgi:hypothetical protein